MKWFLILMEKFIGLFSRKKKAGKEMSDIPKDNYPMF